MPIYMAKLSFSSRIVFFQNIRNTCKLGDNKGIDIWISLTLKYQVSIQQVLPSSLLRKQKNKNNEINFSKQDQRKPYF